MLIQWQIIVINTAIFFGHYIIISSALNFQFGNGGIPNMSSNVSVAVGAFLIVFIIYKPRGLVPEKSLHIKGVDYVGIMRDESRADESSGGSSAP
jgi:ABC-type branched-subunit amino acid transport system permease subunit